jgi:hypothetical protein
MCKNYTCEFCDERYIPKAEDCIQEISMRNIIVFSCLKNVVVYSRISSLDILQWIVYMTYIVQILLAERRGVYYQERQGCVVYYIVLWT